MTIITSNVVNTTSTTNYEVVESLVIATNFNFYTNGAILYTNWIYTPSVVSSTNPVVTSSSSTNSVILQAQAPQAIADVPVTTNANGYVVNFYYPSNVVSANANGTFNFSGSPFISWLVTNTSTSGTFQLQVSQYASGSGLVKQWTCSYSSNTAAWTVQTLGGIQETMAVGGANANTYSVTNIVQYVSGQAAMQTVNTYQVMDWAASTNIVLSSTVVGSGANTKTTSYTNWDPSSIGLTGFNNLLNTVTHPDGSWEYYSSYDASGNPAVVYSSFGDAAVGDTSNGRETDYTYDPSAAGVSGTGDDGSLDPHVARLVVQKIQGSEVSRQYTVFPSVGMRLDIQCTAPGAAWNDPGNLVTTNVFYTNGPNQFALQAVFQPDGTMTAYNYITNGTYQTNITVTGQPDPSGTHVVDGVSNVVVVNIFGGNVAAASYDVLSGAVLSQDIYANFDSFGRPQQVMHLDGTTEYSYYACCGLNYTSDRDGVTNVFVYDTDHRQLGFDKYYNSSYPVQWLNVLDAASRVVQSQRTGTDGSTITLGQSAYDLAGELTARTNALNGATLFTRTNDPVTGGLIRTSTNPDGGVTTNFYYADGTLKKTVGTAVHGKAYGYGVEYVSALGGYHSYAVETNLDNSGNLASEWTKTYTDVAGRTVETLYADGHYSQSYYNNLGQLTNSIDPDGVSTLYAYNGKGELAFTTVDVSHNYNVFGSLNRITQSTNYVTTDGGVAVQRSLNYVWLDGASSGTLVSSNESSANGLDQWQAQFRDASTPVTTHRHTVPGVSRTVTTTNLDNSYTVNNYSYGRLVASTRYDSGNNQIGGTTYGYDAQGRQNTLTDARNGTTTLGFNHADLVATNTTPNPGGGSPEVTVTSYNNMLQATGVLQPDGTTVSSVYLLTGELGQQSGSRTYPVGYSYDYAGRMATMTNWSGGLGGAGARVTTWLYDGQRGWLTNKLYADGHGPSYTYTPAGRLASRVWVRGVTTSYAYDTSGSLTNINYSDGTPGVTNSYDRLGRLSSIFCNGMTDTLSYNLANELLSEAFSGGTLNGLSVTNGYDADLRRTNLSALAASSQLRSASYAYDNASRLASVTDANNNSAAYSYLANSPLVSQIGFKQSGITRMTTTKSYDYLNRLTQISSAPSASYTLPLAFNYNYNAANQRTHDTLADGSYWVYGYDSLGQVTNACKYFADGTRVAGQQFDYTFDTIGNRLQTLAGGDTNGANLRVANYTNNALNQVTGRDVPGYVDVLGASILTNAVTVNGQTAYRKEEYFRQQLGVNNSASALWTNITVSGGQSVTGSVYVAQEPEVFQYDADGNLTNDGRWAYIWDAENRLTGMTNNTGVGPRYQLTFAYDSKGRRIQKLVATNGVGIYTNRFLYDGWNLVATLSPSSQLLSAYTWGSDLSGSQQGAGGVGGLLEVSFGTTNCFPAYDGNGNVAALINAADGTVVANYDYAAFGEPIRMTGIMARNNPFRFSTKYADDESDLLYYGYRYYKPSTGTWPNRDPLGEPGGLNLYGFVANNPLNLIDTDGKASAPSAPPTTALPQRVTRTVTSTTIKSACCLTVVDVEFELHITDTTGSPLVGAYTTETISILAQEDVFSQFLSTGAAPTHPGGILHDTCRVTFWTCSSKPAFINIEQVLNIGARSAVLYTDVNPSGLGLATLTASFY